MTAGFTRVSVVHGARQVDLCVPSGRPVAEVLLELPDWFSIPSGQPAQAWALSTTRHGALHPDASWNDSGVRNGDVLVLSAPGQTADPPLVHDVVEAASRFVDAQPDRWSESDRRRIGRWFAAVALAAGWLGMASVPDPGGATALLLLAGSALLVARRAGRSEWRRLAWLAPVAVAGAVARLVDLGSLWGVAGAVGAGLAALSAAAWVSGAPRWLPVASGTAGLLGIGSAGAALAGLSVLQVAACTGLASAVLVLVLPRLMLWCSRLPVLAAQAESGRSLPLLVVQRACSSALAAADAGATAAAVGAAFCCGALLGWGHGGQCWFGWLLATLALVRARTFSRVPCVAPLVAVPLVAVLGAVGGLPWRLGVTTEAGRGMMWAACSVAVALSCALMTFSAVGDAAAARLIRLCSALEVAVVIALLPTFAWAAGFYGWLLQRF